MSFDSLNRRDFLFYSGATVAGVTLGESGRRLLARADERTAFSNSPGVESWATSVCRECPAGCGIRVRLVDSTPVKIDGNPLCPVARGRLCAKGQAAIEAHFDPDRLVGPARRLGRRGEGRWTSVSWDEALALVAGAIGRARADQQAIVALSASAPGPIETAWSGFWAAVGARTVFTPQATADRFAPHFAALTGAAGDPIFDLEHATFVLSFAAPIVEDWLSPLWSQRSYGRFRRGAGRARGRLVQVEGRRSLTARKADEWLPVASDRQAALVYGIASVLFREDRIDRDRLRDIAGNLAAFEADVVSRYTPDEVALATGVPVVTLLRLARDLTATTHPLVVVAADAPPEVVDAVFALNALLNAFDRTGGVLESAERAAAGAPNRTAGNAPTGETPMAAPAVILLRDASALRAFTTAGTHRRALETAGLVVSLSSYLDEAANVADLILPAHGSLESWHAVVPPASDGAEKLACARAAVDARLDTRDVVSVLHAIAGKLGGDLNSACPFDSSAAVVSAAIGGIYDERRGTPYASTFETNWMRQLERGGWWISAAPSRETFLTAVLDAGGWTDPYFEQGQLRHSIVERRGLTFLPPAAHVDRPAVVVDARAGAPRIVPTSLGGAQNADGDHDDRSLELVTFTPATVNLVGSPNQPVLFELLGQPESAPWRVWAEISPETAREHRIESGATVRVSSVSGSIEAIVLFVEGMPRSTIAVAFVPAGGSGGRWARLVDADVRRLWGGDVLPGGRLPVRVTTA